jgi:D-alanine-D-alanine ligase
VIAVIQGGHESEAEVSRMTSRSFQEALDELGRKYKVIEYDEGFRHNLETLKPDVCLLALHGKYAEDGVVQALLEKMGIPYTGSGVEASKLAFSKQRSIEEALKLGVPVLPHVMSYPDKDLTALEVKTVSEWTSGFVVKPSESGSSRGVTLCDHIDELSMALLEAFKWDDSALIEKRVKGREITISLFEGEVFEPIEIRPRTGFYDMKNKYTKGATDYLIPAPISEELKKACQGYALKIYKNFNLRTYARVDFLVESDESEAYFMEANTLPGCTKTSLLPMALAYRKIPFTRLIETLVQTASCS